MKIGNSVIKKESDNLKEQMLILKKICIDFDYNDSSSVKSQLRKFFKLK